MRLYIFGAGATGKEIVELVKRVNRANDKPVWNEVFFIDDVVEGREGYGISIIRSSELPHDTSEFEMIIALGEPKYREIIYHQFKEKGVCFATIIDPSCNIAETTKIGEGTIVLPFTFISAYTEIGKNCLIEIGTIIGHEIIVGNHSVVSTMAVLGGKSTYGNNVFIGMNATVKEKISVGNKVIIAMSAAVFNDIDDGMIVVGNPARVSRKNVDEKVF